MSFENITLEGEQIDPSIIKDCSARSLSILSLDEQGVIDRIKDDLTVVGMIRIGYKGEKDAKQNRIIIDEDNLIQDLLPLCEEMESEVLDKLEHMDEEAMDSTIEIALASTLVYSTLEHLLVKT